MRNGSCGFEDAYNIFVAFAKDHGLYWDTWVDGLGRQIYTLANLRINYKWSFAMPHEDLVEKYAINLTHYMRYYLDKAPRELFDNHPELGI